ncbi:MAG TPA: hypothetical protein VK665_09825 [Candidatus Elarobacter sp.]|nr:hypothetical protein [Candidatus Elarobacter sp.]
MTLTYTLVLDTGGTDAAPAAAAPRWALAKPGGNALPNVVWLAVPVTGRTTVTWSESYGLYASSAAIRDGTPIAVERELRTALDRMLYPFSGDAFGPPADAPRTPAGHYEVVNRTAGTLTFGLLQAADVGGAPFRGAINAVALPPGFTADFSPMPTVFVWLDSAARSGSIVAELPATAARLTFSAGRRVRECRYEQPLQRLNGVRDRNIVPFTAW